MLHCFRKSNQQTPNSSISSSCWFLFSRRFLNCTYSWATSEHVAWVCKLHLVLSSLRRFYLDLFEASCIEMNRAFRSHSANLSTMYIIVIKYACPRQDVCLKISRRHDKSSNEDSGRLSNARYIYSSLKQYKHDSILIATFNLSRAHKSAPSAQSHCCLRPRALAFTYGFGPFCDSSWRSYSVKMGN